MLIGEDFDKISIHFAGFQFLEPNALIGDILILIQSISYFFQFRKFQNNSSFFTLWRIAFILFGISFLLGGLGHFLFIYTGIFGKSFSWFGGIIAVFFIEKAMISIYPNQVTKQMLSLLIDVKLIVCCVAELVILTVVDLSQDQSIGLIIPMICSTVGLFMTVGYLGNKYAKIIHLSFNYFLISTFVLLPNLFIQGLKINLSPFFDRNDFSHLLIMISFWCYFQAIKGFHLSKLSK